MMCDIRRTDVNITEACTLWLVAVHLTAAGVLTCPVHSLFSLRLRFVIVTCTSVRDSTYFEQGSCSQGPCHCTAPAA